MPILAWQINFHHVSLLTFVGFFVAAAGLTFFLEIEFRALCTLGELSIPDHTLSLAGIA
jgi:hypothetical protein